MREEYSDEPFDPRERTSYDPSENVDTTFHDDQFISPVFDFKSLPVDLKNENIPFILIGLFLLYRWFT